MAHSTKQDGFYLYPKNSSKIDLHNFRVSGLLRGLPFNVVLQVIRKIDPDREYFKKTKASSTKLILPRFSRVCIDQGLFGTDRAKLAFEQRNLSPYWNKIALLNIVSTFIGERKIDQLMGHSRKFDPTDFSKKSLADATNYLSLVSNVDELGSNPTKFQYCKRDLYEGVPAAMSILNKNELFNQHIPNAAKSAFNLQTLDYNDEKVEKLLSLLGPYLNDIYFTNTQFDSKQTRFRYTLEKIGLTVTDLLPLLQCSEKLLHEDLKQIAASIKKEIFQQLLEQTESYPAAERFFSFWYEPNNRISLALHGRLLSLTPFRSIIHTLPYTDLKEWENSLYYHGTVPHVDTLANVYGRLYKYKDYLELSRNKSH